MQAASNECKQCVMGNNKQKIMMIPKCAADADAVIDTLDAMRGKQASPHDCPSMGNANFGGRYCEFLVSDAAGLTTVWISQDDPEREDECAEFLDISCDDIQAAWPELNETGSKLIRNGPRTMVTSCSGYNTMRQVIEKMTMDEGAWRTQSTRTVGTPPISFKPQAQLNIGMLSEGSTSKPYNPQ